MSFGEVAAALGLLTPLVLGVLAFYKDLKKKDKAPAEPASHDVVQGMTVNMDYAAELMRELKKRAEDAESERDTALAEVAALRATIRTMQEFDRR